jgi:hypothetical protein
MNGEALDQSPPPPADLRAAERALGTYQSTHADIAPVPIHGAALEVLDEVLFNIAASREIDIVGVFPSQCALRMIEIDAERRARGTDMVVQRTVRYFTPARVRIVAYRHAGVLGTLVQRWLGGITGLRNWLAPRWSKGSDANDALSVFEFDDMYLDCVVIAKSPGETFAVVLTQLPLLIETTEGSKSATAVIVHAVLAPEECGQLESYVEALAKNATPMAPPQVRCRSQSGGDPADLSFTPVISRLSPYGRSLRDDVEPISVVAVCADSAQGKCVLLKRRMAHNSRDDFQTLSLVSERLLLEDLASWIGSPTTNELDNALDEIWLRAGQPAQLELPESVFRRAAQRELFVCCGLDVGLDRLEHIGTALLDREGQETYLGFYIYRLKLIRTAENDEYRSALEWNRDLVSVPVAQLYGPAYRQQLNRLLKRQESLIRTTVLKFHDNSGVIA